MQKARLFLKEKFAYDVVSPKTKREPRIDRVCMCVFITILPHTPQSWTGPEYTTICGICCVEPTSFRFVFFSFTSLLFCVVVFAHAHFIIIQIAIDDRWNR